MAKNLPANVLTAIAAEQKAPVLLFELALDGITLRHAASKTNIVFPHGGAVTYTAKTVLFENIEQSAEGQIGRAVVRYDNVQQDMAAYANALVFENHTLTIKRIYLDADGNPPADATEYNEVFAGPMEQPKNIDEQWLEVSATAGKPLKRRALLEKYQKPCRHRFGDDSSCNVDGNADLDTLTASGTADSGSTTTLVDNALTQAADYWNYGKIQITIGSNVYWRKVKDFDAGLDKITFNVALPEAVDGSTTYQVWKGCDWTWDTCEGSNAWGPSADNTLNYGGCLHIASSREA